LLIAAADIPAAAATPLSPQARGKADLPLIGVIAAWAAAPRPLHFDTSTGLQLVSCARAVQSYLRRGTLAKR